MYRLAIVLALAIAPISAAAQTPAMDLEAIRKRLDDDASLRQLERDSQRRVQEMERRRLDAELQPRLRDAEIDRLREWWQKHLDGSGWGETPRPDPDYHDFTGASPTVLSPSARGSLGNMPDPEPTDEDKRQKMLREIVMPIAGMAGLFVATIFGTLVMKRITMWARQARERRHEFKRGLLG